MDTEKMQKFDAVDRIENLLKIGLGAGKQITANAIDSPLLLEAYAQYLDAYRLDLNSYYPGLNALFLAVIILELASRYPDVWSAPFADDATANVKLDEIKRKRDQIAQALQLRFDSADAPVPEGAKQDMWFLSSAGDLNLLAHPPNPRRRPTGPRQ